MLLSIFILFVLAFHTASSLECYKCAESHVDFWIDAKTLPSFPTNCSLVTAKKQCTAAIRWFTLRDGKESYVDYSDDFDLDFLPKDSSLFFAFVDIERELQTASTRALIYSCMTDNCNDQASLQRALNSLTLEENFAPLDVLFNKDTANFTDQSSCVNFSNSTHLECPTQASPLSSCSSCLLLEMESFQEVCARCPAVPPGPNVDFVDRQVFFFLENRTRLADKSTLVCRTKGCNALNNVEKVHQLSKLEFDFNKFFASSSSMTMVPALSILLNLLLLLTYFL
jgi:hypothetical protein